jgi:hypothetical protein
MGPWSLCIATDATGITDCSCTSVAKEVVKSVMTHSTYPVKGNAQLRLDQGGQEPEAGQPVVSSAPQESASAPSVEEPQHAPARTACA